MPSSFLLDAGPDKMELRELMRQELGDLRGWLAEIGTGGGWYLGTLGVPGHRTVGVDMDAGGLGSARARFPNPSWVRCDATRLPFRNGSLAGMICSEVLEHIPDDGAAASELARVARPEAKLVVTVPNGSARWGWGFAEFDRRVGHVRRYSLESLAALLSPEFRLEHGAHHGHWYAFAALVVLQWPARLVSGRGGAPCSGGENRFYVERPLELRGPLAWVAAAIFRILRAMFRGDMQRRGHWRSGNGILAVFRRRQGP